MCDDNHDDPHNSPSSDSLSNRFPNRQPAESRFRFRQGWIIEGRRATDGATTGRYLQIGTGQWCPPQYATIFPVRQTAMIYAHEFGYSLGHDACIVRFCDHG